MLWVLKRTVSRDGSFEHTKHVNFAGLKNIFMILHKKMFIWTYEPWYQPLSRIL